jgi:hypothetical protein
MEWLSTIPAILTGNDGPLRSPIFINHCIRAQASKLSSPLTPLLPASQNRSPGLFIFWEDMSRWPDDLSQFGFPPGHI